jgi:hypothetical protein
MHLRRLAAAVSLSLAAACTDFATPAELTKPTVLAVIADPPVVAPGASSVLETVVVDGTGRLQGLTQRQVLVETYPGVPPMGRVEADGGAIRYVAPDPVPMLPDNAAPLDSVQIEIDVPSADGVQTLRTVKLMAVTSAVATANPTITRLGIGEADGLAGGVTLARNATVMLDVAIDPPAGEDARIAWYTSAGLIERYQSTPTELVASEDAASGWIFVVVRDGVGGVVWHGVPVTVE